MEDLNLWQITLHQFRESALNFDHIWRLRSRVFTTFNVVLALLDLCVGQEKSYRSVLEHFSPDQNISPAASSFCKARSKFPAYIIGEIRAELLDVWDSTKKNDLWFGYQTYAIDGSWLNLPRGLLQNGFKIPGNGHYPRGLLTAALRTSDRMLIDLSLTNSFDEREAAKPMLDQFTSRDVLIYDRGYLSYFFLREHIKRNIKAVFRVSKGSNLKQIEDAWKRKETDFLIDLSPGKSTLRKDLGELRQEESTIISLRVIKYKIGDEDYMLITNIFDRSIQCQDFQALYGSRWMIEEFFKPYKQTIKIENFHSKTLNGVEQEIQAAGLLWNLTMLMDSMIPVDFKKTA